MAKKPVQNSDAHTERGEMARRNGGWREGGKDKAKNRLLVGLLIFALDIHKHNAGGTSRRKDVPGPSWDGVNELALAAFTAGVAGVCMASEDMIVIQVCI